MARYNTHTIAIQVPIAQIVKSGHPTIGIYASASRQKVRVLRNDGTIDSRGRFVQVSRLGEPLINEAVIPLGQKDLWNRLDPEDDGQFASLYTNPELARLENLLYGSALTPVDEHGRTDLVAILLTGVPGLNFTGPRKADLLRLNTSIAPTAAVGSGNRLGVLAGDLAGFPNGRRLEDDIVDIELRAIAQGYGSVLHSLLGLPDKSPNNLLGDGVDANDKPFFAHFPYVASAAPGLRRSVTVDRDGSHEELHARGTPLFPNESDDHDAERSNTNAARCSGFSPRSLPDPAAALPHVCDAAAPPRRQDAMSIGPQLGDARRTADLGRRIAAAGSTTWSGACAPSRTTSAQRCCSPTRCCVKHAPPTTAGRRGAPRRCSTERLKDAPAHYDALRMLGRNLSVAAPVPRGARRGAGGRGSCVRPTPWNYGVMGDALLELGDYDQAFDAFDTMATMRPTAAAYARVSYGRELRGDLNGAVEAMRMAGQATTGRIPRRRRGTRRSSASCFSRRKARRGEPRIPPRGVPLPELSARDDRSRQGDGRARRSRRRAGRLPRAIEAHADA